jgi:HK97 family phage prohead protease
MHELKVFDFTLASLDYEGRTLEGYTSVFGVTDLGRDVVHPGAFAKTLAERGNKLRFLWQHNPAEPLGKILEAREDERGLYLKAVISDTARGRDALALLRDGAISGLSIGYDAIQADYTKDQAGNTVRNLREVRLWEASLVSFPMNEAAGVTALKEASPPADAPPAPDADALAQMHSTIASLQTRLTALEAQLAPAEKAGRADEPSLDQAGPLPTAPTSTLETALQELALLLKIS